MGACEEMEPVKGRIDKPDKGRPPSEQRCSLLNLTSPCCTWWRTKSRKIGSPVSLVNKNLFLLFTNVESLSCLPKRAACLTRSSLVATLRTTRVSMIKRRRGTRQAMLLSVSVGISWVWPCWDSDVGWGFCWGSWPPCIGGRGCCWTGFSKLFLSSVWVGGSCSGSFGTVALARLSLSILVRNVSNSESHGEEPPAWNKRCTSWVQNQNHKILILEICIFWHVSPICFAIKYLTNNA